MTPKLAPVADKIGKLIRLLGSDKDGEVLGAVTGLRRTLGGAGLDFHDLADAITVPLPRQAAVSPDWLVQLRFCASKIGQLNSRDADFISSLIAASQWREPTARQRAWLCDIVARLRRAAA